jgi:hypothetical protein
MIHMPVSIDLAMVLFVYLAFELHVQFVFVYLYIFPELSYGRDEGLVAFAVYLSTHIGLTC